MTPYLNLPSNGNIQRTQEASHGCVTSNLQVHCPSIDRANTSLGDFSQDQFINNALQSSCMASPQEFTTWPDCDINFCDAFKMPMPSQPMDIPMNRRPSQQDNPYPSPISEHFSFEEDSGMSRTWQPLVAQHTSCGIDERSLPNDVHRDKRSRLSRSNGCRQQEEPFLSTPMDDCASTKRRITGRKKDDPKRISRAKVSKRPKGPRTFCDIPGCGVSVARAVDIQRHKKVKHGGDEHKFTCLLCKNGQSQSKSKEDWVFGLKYNLME